MALETTTSTGLTPQYQKYFSKKLLEHAVQSLVLDQFGQRVPFPKNAGAKTIRFMRPDVGDRTQVQTLTEGVPISTFRETTWTPVDLTLAQFGEAAKLSDLLNMTDLFSTLKQNISSMGEDAALHADFQITSAVVPLIAAANKRYSGGAANFNALVALTNAQGAMTIQDLLGSMTQLTIQRAPKAKGGDYVAVVPPQIGYDLMNDGKFVDSGKYGTTKGLFNGEIGRWYGVRVVVATQPWREANTNGTEGTFSASGPIFSTVVLGSGAYGIPLMAGQSPFSPKVIINDKPDKSDPLNQFITAGWSAYWTAGLLNDLWAVIVRSKTTFA